MFNITLRIRTNYANANGEHPLIIVLTDKKQSKEIATGFYCAKKYYLKKEKKLSHFAPDYQSKKIIIDNYFTRANDFITKDTVLNLNSTFESFVNYVLNIVIVPDRINYFSFVTAYLENKKHLFSTEHLKGCKTELSKLKKFKEVLYFDEINYSFLQDYEKYMFHVLNNKVNTVHKTFKRMKSNINEALRQGILLKNPFENYKLTTEKTQREFLSINELKTLEVLYFSAELNPKLKKVLQYFLFCCYTGLRYQDIFLLTNANIVNNSYVQLTMHKTNDLIIIPLSDKAKELIDKSIKGKLFNVLSNQKTNDYLKVIMLQAQIEKEISFHCSRHTFATISISLGIPIEVISKLLGHTQIKQTMIYAKIIDNVKAFEIDKWNKL